MVVCNGVNDIRFARRVIGMGIAALFIAVALVPVMYMAIGNEGDAGSFDAVPWVAGLAAVVIMFFGMACILYDRFRRMRRDRDYWMYLCNEYRMGRSPRLERVWRGLKSTEDLEAMDVVEAELPDCWKKSYVRQPRNRVEAEGRGK